MYSVTKRAQEFKQPRGGFLNPKSFKMVEFNDGESLNEDENIHPILVGLAVDYLCRFMRGTPVSEAFGVSLAGGRFAKESKKAERLASKIKGLDDESIINACKLVGYDVCARNSAAPFNGVDHIEPNDETIENIRIMVNRGLLMLEKVGKVLSDGFVMPGAYTEIVSTGDGDILTDDGIWDFKVSKKAPTSKQTLQLLMYYLMGTHSLVDSFQEVNKLGFLNPRLNALYEVGIDDIDKDILKTVSVDVIGYKR